MRLSDARHAMPEKRREFFRLMRRQFTDGEWQQIKGDVDANNADDAPENGQKDVGSQQLAAFYRHWSLKESFVKATGSGPGLGLPVYSRSCVLNRNPQALHSQRRRVAA